MPFNFDLDVVIFIVFLTANLIFGLLSSRGISNIKEYAIGDRNFSTATIAATIVATWISGEFFFSSMSETYSQGLIFIVASLGDIICILLVGWFFAPRMGEFLGKLSIAEAMGDLFGKNIQMVTAICGFVGVGGIIAVQLKIAGLIFEYAFDIDPIYGVIISGIILTLYSSLGGIKSVTFTDVIQFFTFGTVIPVIAYFLLANVGDVQKVTEYIATNPSFDYKKVFDPASPKLFYHLSLLVCFAIPAFNPAIFQRISMAKSTQQSTKSFMIAAIICLILLAFISWISVLMLAIDPNIASDDVVKHMILKYSSVGLKGLILSGVMAMIMSTADSYINSAAVLIVHDFFKPLKMKFIKNELLSARLVSVILGIFSILLSLREGSVLNLITFAFALYMPIISPPFIMAILGFRSSEKSVLFGMAGGLITVLIWHYYEIKCLDSVAPAMLMNLLLLVGSHYLLKQPGGWVGIKDKGPLLILREERRKAINAFWREIKNFNLVTILKRNCPEGDGMISLLGFFVMISAFSSVYALPQSFQTIYQNSLGIFYPIALGMSTALISYPLWLPGWKETNLLAVTWSIIMFSMLICFSFYVVLISDFAEMQIIAFMMNVVLIGSLIRWRWALFNILVGVSIVAFYFNYHSPADVINQVAATLQYKIIYLLLLISGTLVLFLKPRQAFHQLTEEKVDHLTDRVSFQDQEICKLTELKNEFLRNLEHEVRTPITGITSLGQVLDDGYDKFSEKQRRGIIHDISRSGERLNSLASNLIDLSKLSTLKYEFHLELVDLSALVSQRLEECKKLYISEDQVDNYQFVLAINEDVIAKCDKYYISRTLDNLIINAIQYCKGGEIVILLSQNGKMVEFSISDEGVGVPESELYDIFGAFAVSSRTRSPAGGRGLGLALCKKVVDLHNGIIKAETNPSGKGIKFTFMLKAPA